MEWLSLSSSSTMDFWNLLTGYMIMIANLVTIEKLFANPTRLCCMEGGFICLSHLHWLLLLQLVEDELLHLLKEYKTEKLFKREDCGENKITPIGNRKPHLQKRIWKDDIPSPAHWKRPWSHPVHDRRIDAPLLRRSEQRWIRCCTVHVSSPARCFLQQWVAQLSSLGLRCPHKLWTETVHTQKQKKKDKEALKLKKKSCKKTTK